ncbi:GNAT family N-acetyltransferase [Streptomyces sp. SolWspMP-sol7th]|uniref:GNAT family N-acetyltransferase n=1 Tax=Streptomyces sp. SolWspMP-sol7th TaxID=1839776 RepID=UPI0020C81A7B|nr:GNAT family N-acetyltransferase [Streptomyces sp. SolWspMP-sol7th]
MRTAPGGAPARVACLGGVATLPQARGKGHVRRMLDLAVARMTEDDCAWSLLFTGTPRVYEGAGWTTYEAPPGRAPSPHRPARPAASARRRRPTSRTSPGCAPRTTPPAPSPPSAPPPTGTTASPLGTRRPPPRPS